MVPVYDYREWVGLLETQDSWGYYPPGDDPDSDLHWGSLDALVLDLAESGPVRGATVEIIAVARRGGPWHKIEVNLEKWCSQYEPELLDE